MVVEQTRNVSTWSDRSKKMPSTSRLLGIRKSNEHCSKVVSGFWRKNTRKTRVTDTHENNSGFCWPKRRVGDTSWPITRRQNNVNVPVKSKLKHPPSRAYPGHLTSFPVREGGNLMNLVFPGAGHLIIAHRGWGIWSLASISYYESLQEPITRSLHLPYKLLESTLSDEKLFIEIVLV